MAWIHLSIRTKLVAAMVLPLAVLVGLAGYDLSLKRETRSEMVRLGQLVEGVAGMSRLIHELQRELGVSALFVGSKGSQFKDELPRQRGRTDAERNRAAGFLAELRNDAASEDFRRAIIAATEVVAGLETGRRDV